MDLPSNVSTILNKLTQAGYEAYVVGGCVRDYLLDKQPHDYDITTNASPAEIKQLFPNSLSTGEKYGTITVIVDNIPYEVTTYRVDGKYTDGRRPDNVKFVSSLKEDLQRRDFTINAIAYNSNGFVDPFGGIDDLSNRIIRCVGNPADRLSEDYLRIIRMYRFAVKYSFEIDMPTYSIASKLLEKDCLKSLAKERIHDELEKIFSLDIESTDFELVNTIFSYILRQAANYEPSYDLDERSMFNVYDNISPKDKLGYLLYCYTHSVEDSVKILGELKYSNRDISYVKKLLTVFTKEIKTVKELKKTINEIGDFDTVRSGLYLKYYEAPKEPEILTKLKQLEVIKKEKHPVTISQLKIDGDDLMEQFELKPGPIIGEILQSLLDAVMEETIPNEKSELLKFSHYLLTKKH